MLCATLIATTFACSSAVKSVENKVDENAEAITKNESMNQNAENANDVGNQSETLGNAASAYALSIDNKTIDSTVYLDYKKGIEEKVYKWVKSDDGKYYTFAYIDETGNPVKSSEAKINVGANNQESIDNGNKNNVAQGNIQQSDRPQGSIPQGERPGGGKQGGMPGGMPGGMMEMMRRNAEVLRGVYINANITNIENQTMLIYAPAEYFNVDEDGNDLTLTGLRSGTYYDTMLNNISDALNKFVESGEGLTINEEENKSWLRIMHLEEQKLIQCIFLNQLQLL